MSVKNFMPTLWEGAILANFHNRSVAANGALSAQPESVTAEKVRFTAIGSGKVKDYTKGSIAWDELETTNVDLIFDQEKYFAFKLADVDKAQMKRDLLMDATEEHSAVMAELYDRYFFKTLIDGVATGNAIGTASAKTKVHKLNFYDVLVDMGTKLSEMKVPNVNRFVTISSALLGLLSKDPRFKQDPKVLANGVVEGQFVNGMQVVMSEELPKNQAVAHYRKAIGAGTQIDKVEAMRLQDDFSDGVRGLQKYGAKVLRPQAIVVLNYEIVDTPTVSVTAGA
uniref:phage major capsid protein n=1 Tax=Ndongobacter massiliensis TaxID=1871025 RepID=UPI000930146E|nr:hypothetical protein [Ndongobacter massiliensis]